MAVFSGPDINEDGLLLSFDASNSKSVYTSVSKRFYGLGGGENNYLALSSTGVAHSTSGYYDLDGSTGYLSTTLPLDRSTYPDFTVEAWINADSLGSSNVIMARGNGGQGGFDFKFDLYDAGYLRGTLYDTSSSNVQSIASSPGGVISTGSWYHCAISFSNGSYIKTYVNGIDVTHSNYVSNTYSRNTGNSSLPLVVGRSDTGSDYFNGKISGLKYYTRALSADEILSNYRAFDKRNFSQTIAFAATPKWTYPIEGQVVFTSFNTTLNSDVSWTVPTGVTEISAVCVGGGGGGGGCNGGTDGNGSAGGGGGGLAYGTFAVTPGETLTIRVGSGGTGAPSGPASPIQVADPGGHTYIKRSTTTLLQGHGGTGGSSNVSVDSYGLGGSSSGTERDGGYSGGRGGAATYNRTGAGGGGAGGYSGSGAVGAQGPFQSGSLVYGADGTGGSGAGGDAIGGTSSKNAEANGGGVGLYGEGTSGIGTANKAGSANLSPATGDGRMTAAATLQAGTFGGGGGSIDDDVSSVGHNGGDGGIRIIWGEGRSYPSTNTADV